MSKNEKEDLKNNKPRKGKEPKLPKQKGKTKYFGLYKVPVTTEESFYDSELINIRNQMILISLYNLIVILLPKDPTAVILVNMPLSYLAYLSINLFTKDKMAKKLTAMTYILIPVTIMGYILLGSTLGIQEVSNSLGLLFILLVSKLVLVVIKYMFFNREPWSIHDLLVIGIPTLILLIV